MTIKSKSSECLLDKISEKFQEFTSQPVSYLSVQDNLTDPVKSLVKDIYDLSKTFEISAPKKPVKNNAALKKLIIANLDEEQIWQQLEIQNNLKNPELLRLTSVVLNANQDSLTFPFKYQDEEETEYHKEMDEEDDSIGKEDSDQEDDAIDTSADKDEFRQGDNTIDSDGEGDDVDLSKIDTKSSQHGSIVDDTFFKLDELDRYLEHEDRKEMRSKSDSDEENFVDYFNYADSSEDSQDEDLEGENKGIKFKDFFRNPGEQYEERPKQKKRLRFENESEEDENESNETEEEEEEENREEEEENRGEEEKEEDRSDSKMKHLKSSLELRQERLKSKIEKLEEGLISEKPWQMKGEVAASRRPQNSLLEEVVEFDLTTRPAPEITEKTTRKLEDIIQQRIKDKAWDDVERKIKAVDTPQEFRKKLVLDQEKSKLSLAQIYEQEYIKQAESTTANPLEEKPEDMPKEHEEIKKMMNHLFRQLDALCNFHYTPKMVLPELKIVSNTPAIEMEEVAPVTSSDATLLAPEEIKSIHKGTLMSKEERTDTDKKRERRKKKIHQKLKHKKQTEKEKMTDLVNPGIGKKFNKEKMKKTLDSVTKSKNVNKMVISSDGKALSSSKAFFNQLQDEVKATIKRKTNQDSQNKKKSDLSAKKLKL